jgi:hypothetical protein
LSTDYDETSSIGKRYRRQDEIGTPFCITVDFDTLEGVKRPKGCHRTRSGYDGPGKYCYSELVDYIRAKLA